VSISRRHRSLEYNRWCNVPVRNILFTFFNGKRRQARAWSAICRDQLRQHDMSRKSLGVAVAKNVGHGPRRILCKANKMWLYRRRCRGDIESSFRIFKCEMICTSPRIRLAAVACTFSRRDKSKKYRK